MFDPLEFPDITEELKHTKRRTAPQGAPRPPSPVFINRQHIPLIVPGAVDDTTRLVVQVNSMYLAALTNADVLKSRRCDTLLTRIRTGEEKLCGDWPEQHNI